MFCDEGNHWIALWINLKFLNIRIKGSISYYKGEVYRRVEKIILLENIWWFGSNNIKFERWWSKWRKDKKQIIKNKKSRRVKNKEVREV